MYSELQEMIDSSVAENELWQQDCEVLSDLLTSLTFVSNELAQYVKGGHTEALQSLADDVLAVLGRVPANIRQRI